MSITEQEAVASLRILVAVAQADGQIHEEEKKSIAGALEGISLPAGTTADTLLAETIDVDAQLALLTSPAARGEIWKSAFAMANADGSCSPEEQKLLDVIAEKTQVTAEQKSFFTKLLAEGKDTVLPSNIQAVTDPEKRAKEVRNDILKYSAFTAILGAFPLPVVGEIAVLGIQLKMIRDIGQYWGHTVDKNAAKSMLYGLGLGTGARMAVNSLAKLVPGWGSAVGATTSFAATFALGKVMEKFFAEDAKGDVAALKTFFKSAEKEGKAAYAEQKDDIAKKQSDNKAALEQLSADLKDGKITQEDFDKRLASLT
jgi:uncharacterized protein (DUF697 family)/uncharacterized tellurite resistance protein B-like protein